MAKKTLRFDINPLLGGPSLEARARSGSPYRLIPIENIDADPDQPRRSFDAEGLAELAASIKEHGILCPILVRLTAGGTYRVVAGERRLRAARMVGLEQVPALLDSDSPDEDENTVLAKQLVENLQRQDLAPLERALAIGRLRDQHGWSVREIARRLGTSKSLVQRSLDVLELPKELRDAIDGGASESKVLLVAQITESDRRQQVLDRLDSLSRDDIERIVRGGGFELVESSHGGTGGTGRAVPEASNEDRRIAEEMRRSLGTKVQVVRNPKKEGHGRVVVEFYSSDDLAEIYRRLTQSE